jgi:uncharacterized metal-binding protein YceD (DUF177 family)
MGMNEYTFLLNDEFLSKIDGSAITHANVEASLVLFKTESLYELTFQLKGMVVCECDVCLEDFELPVDEEFKLLIKLSETENYEDDEIIYITEKVIEYDLTQYLYESMMLSIPTRKTCDMSDNKKCNKEVIAKLEELSHIEEEDEDEDDENEDKTNPTWDKLKGIFNN